MLKEKYKNNCLKEIEDQPGYYVDTDGNVYSIKRGKYKRLKPIEAGIPGSKIARLYNISQTNISDIKYRRCWSWL